MAGKRLSVRDRPSWWRTRFIRSAESSRSWMVKAGSRPISSAWSRSSRAPIAWKVPAQVRPSVSAAAPIAQHLARRSARRAASSRRRPGAKTSSAGCGAGRRRCTIRWATRCASVLVLPEPAPAMTSSGPATSAAAMLDRQPLRVVQPAEIGRHVGRIRGDVAHAPMKPRFPFVRNRCRSSDEIDDRGCGSCAASPRLIACAHGEWEAQGLSGQARLRQDDRTSGRRRGRRWQPLRRAQALTRPRPLRPAAGARRRAEELGGAEGAVARSGGEAAGGPDRGPSARIYRLRGRHPGGRVWRRADDRLGHRHLGADGGCGDEPGARGRSSSGWPARSSRAAGCWRG